MQLATFVFLSFAALISNVAASEFDYCYAYDQDPYLLMGTKTAYQFIQGRARLPPVPNCSPAQIWILSRHGTRNPGRTMVPLLLSLPKLRDQIINNHEIRGKGRLCNNDLQALRTWQTCSNLNEAMANELTRQGEQDLRLLARRLQSEFPEILRLDPRGSGQQVYKFQSTNSARTQSSLRAFMEGLFNSKDAAPVEKTPDNDTLLHGYKNCPEWSNSFETDGVDCEVSKFLKGSDFQLLIQNVSLRLGFGYKLSNETILLMYDMCRYEKAWEVNRLSPWCAVFNKDEMKVLEYLEDLKHYYYSGPGREINKKLGCPLLKDMFMHFRNLEQGKTEREPKGIFYFSHSVSLQTLMAILDIGVETVPLTADNYRSMSRRHYRTSIYGAFGSNIVAVFYRCSDAQSPNKVMFYVNESPILMEGCKVGLCDWEYLKQRFGKTAEECNLDFCCNSNSASRLTTLPYASIVGLSMLRSFIKL